MTLLHRSQTTLCRTAIFGVACGFALIGCDGEDKKTPAKVASGGSAGAQTQTETGGSSATVSSGGTTATSTSTSVGSGTSANGGAVGDGGAVNGGATIGNGGATEGGAANGGAAEGGVIGIAGSTSTTAAAGSGASAGTTQTVGTCDSDIDCKALKMLCDTTAKKCVQCLQNVDCTDGAACVFGVCGGDPGCKSNADCAASANGKVCDVTRGSCVACMVAADCPNPTTSECVAHACVAVTTCTNSLDCTSTTAPICNRTPTPARCVQCVADADCVSAGTGKVCSNNQCRTTCSTNTDCTGGLKCNTSVTPNYCAACATSTDCAASQFCSKGECVADVCTAGTDQACVSNAIVTCNADGSGFATPKACLAGQTCSVAASRAACNTVPTTVCDPVPGTVNPCTEIPAFTGTQTVDAKGEDFCTIPSFEFNFKNAAAVNNNKATGGATTAYTQRAIAQVAWSPEAFHAFIEVFGTPVHSNTTVDKPWDGDSIELMITTANSPQEGLSSKDPNVLHIIANNGVAVTVKSDGNSGTHTAINDATKFKGALTSTGYVIELKVPWPSAPTLASGTAMRFDMAMNVDTTAVDPDYPGRDAQAVLVMTALTGTTSCATTPATPFCDIRLWCPTVLK